MNSVLDDTIHIYWWTETATLQFNRFELIVVGGSSGSTPRRVKILFEESVYVSAFNEFARNDEDRGGHIIFQHNPSELIDWLDKHTLIFTTKIEKVDAKDFSILLTDNIYHVISPSPPTVTVLDYVE